MSEKVFLLIAIGLFCALSVFVISDFIAFLKNLKSGVQKYISKGKKRLLYILLSAAYSSLMLFAVLSELTAGETISAAIMLGIKVCFLNTLRPPVSFIVIMLLCVLIQDKIITRKCGTDGSLSHDEHGDG